MNISPSQVKKWRECQRKYAFEYVEGKRPEASHKMQFGLAMHFILENWLRDKKPPPDTPEGNTAKQGLKYLPHPDPDMWVEKKFNIEAMPGVRLTGIVDCVHIHKDGICVIDHKSTSNLKYAMGAKALHKDPQALIYSMWALDHFQLTTCFIRWIYYCATSPKTGPRVPNGVQVVDGMFDTSDLEFLHDVKEILFDIKKIVDVRIKETPGNELPPTVSSCRNFGGCPHVQYCKLDQGDLMTRCFGESQ